ncbi:MAG: TonB-dependent receptor plug domain-containing protein, partial [Bacteroidota bacterium]
MKICNIISLLFISLPYLSFGQYLTKDTLSTTALHLQRAKVPLGHHATTLSGDILAATSSHNLLDALAGRIPGLQITPSYLMGGSSNASIRGIASFTNNTQPLFVLDGLPINNSVFNIEGQNIGRGGYDYGNIANDINLEDIQSINILRGGAATTLYGMHGANGAILLTTKQGHKPSIRFSTSIAFSRINANTAPTYQQEYGAGYGAFYDDPSRYFQVGDLNNDGILERIVPTAEDASWGARFDPDLLVVHWDALNPLANNFGELRPYVAPENGVLDFFETGITTRNQLAFTQKNWRLAYTNEQKKDVLPLGRQQRHWLNLHTKQTLLENLHVSFGATFFHQNVQGRAGTGYDRLNVMRSLGQWFQANVDMERLGRYLDANGQQLTWNRSSLEDARPRFFDNPYFTRHENTQRDGRHRLLTYGLLNYQLSKYVHLQGRTSADIFTDVQKERVSTQSIVLSNYTERWRTQTALNLELLLRTEKQLSNALHLRAMLGGNYS